MGLENLFAPGTVLLNKYRIEDVIGKGGFGAVYKATDLKLRRSVAIKMLLHGETSLDDRYGIGTYEEFIRRFEREAEISSYFTQNPHIITVYGLEQDAENNYYLILEYLEGGSLGELLKRTNQPLPLERVYTIGKDICLALEDIHNHPADIVHRDLKPANILLRANGQALVADFGVAQIGRDSHRTELHQTNSRHPGSPPYKSPEQENSYNYLSPASDLYTLGLILYEMATGKLYRKVQIMPPSQLNPAVPYVLDAIIEKLLRANPLERYRQASDLRRDLEKAAQNRLTAEQVLGAKVAAPEDDTRTQLLPERPNADYQITPGRQTPVLGATPLAVTPVPAIPSVRTQPPTPPEPEPETLTHIPERKSSRRRLWPVIAGLVLFFLVGATVLAATLGGFGATKAAPTVTPAPTATVANTARVLTTVAPTVTPQPTSTPQPTVTLAPTVTAEPTATVAPTATPEPTATISPTVEPTVTPLPVAPLSTDPQATSTPEPFQPSYEPAQPVQPLPPTATPVPPTPTATPEPTTNVNVPTGATPVAFPTPITILPPTPTAPPTSVVTQPPTSAPTETTPPGITPFPTPFTQPSPPAPTPVVFPTPVPNNPPPTSVAPTKPLPPTTN